MSITRRIKLYWRILRLTPKLETLDSTVPTLEAMHGTLIQLEALERFQPRLQGIQMIVNKVHALDARTPELDVLQTMIHRLEQLDRALLKLSQSDSLKVKETQGVQKAQEMTVTEKNELNRLRMLTKFFGMADKIELLESEWQKIQQDEHDEYFAYQMFRGEGDSKYAYKKGVVDGIKWCIEKFS